MILDANSIEFMKEFLEHQDEKITIGLVGEKRTVKIKMSDTMKTRVADMYKLYEEAGGATEESLGAITPVTPMTVEEIQ